MNFISRYFEQRKIDAFMTRCGLSKEDYTINRDDMSVDVNTSVSIKGFGLAEIPIKFGRVFGSFDCSENGLKSLKNCPEKIDGAFDCSNNQLKSLEFGPKEVGPLREVNSTPYDCSHNQLMTAMVTGLAKMSYDCSHNQLTSLRGISNNICRDLYCSNNALRSFEYLPECVSAINARYNQISSFCGLHQKTYFEIDLSLNHLESLDGCPAGIERLDVAFNKLKTLNGISEDSKLILLNVSFNTLASIEGCPKKLNDFDCSNNQLITLSGGPEQVVYFDCSSNALTSLVGGPKEITSPLGEYNASWNNLRTLEGAPKTLENPFDFFAVAYNTELRNFDRLICANGIHVGGTDVRLDECIENMKYKNALAYSVEIQKPEMISEGKAIDTTVVELGRFTILDPKYEFTEKHPLRSWEERVKVRDTILMKEAMEAKLATKTERIEDLSMAKAQSHTQSATRSGKRKI
ncbi:E3 ubiquitin-protein ligase sspH2 [Burkholderia pseudomallei]|nr:E3 ubiquitin-protein ligase sspH2 [Burkholderia pseudomallei]